MPRTVVTLVFLVSLAGCFSAATGEVLGGDPNRVALPPGGWLDDDLQGAKDPITLDQANRADELLVDSGRLPGDLDDYVRQYGVFPTDDDGQMVFVNAGCTDMSESADWKQQQLLVMDGGDCYWRARVDVTAGKVLGVTVNGES